MEVLVAQSQPEPPAPPVCPVHQPEPDVPGQVLFAAAFVQQYRVATMPQTHCTEVAEIEIGRHVPRDAELGAVDAACELLAAFFDECNPRVAEGRAKAGEIGVPTEKELGPRGGRCPYPGIHAADCTCNGEGGAR